MIRANVLHCWLAAVSKALNGVQVDAAAARLRDSVVSTAESDLTSQAYWLSATLALGAFLKVCSPLLHHPVLFCLPVHHELWVSLLECLHSP